MTEDLFSYLPAHQRHSPTSKAAAESIKPRIGPMHRLILAYLRDCPHGLGATDEELQEALYLSGSTQRPRRRELQTSGLIIDSGKTRSTSSGRKAVVWILAGEK